MAKWVQVAVVGDCPAGGAWEVVAEDRVVALFNVGGEFFALDGVCPHQGGPLGKGTLAGHVVTCPWHGWQFDVRSGQHQSAASVCQAVLPLKIEGEGIFVDVEA